jgi:hypothetical protein
MKNAVILSALLLLTLVIVLPIKSIVNHSLGNPVLLNPTLRVDGNPYPPLPPKKPSLSPSTLVPDGNLYPPLPPKKPSLSSDSLIADGNPYPPLPPKKPSSGFGSPDPGLFASATLLGTSA